MYICFLNKKVNRIDPKLLFAKHKVTYIPLKLKVMRDVLIEVYRTLLSYSANICYQYLKKCVFLAKMLIVFQYSYIFNDQSSFNIWRNCLNVSFKGVVFLKGSAMEIFKFINELSSDYALKLQKWNLECRQSWKHVCNS